jgi:ribosomal protein L24
LEEQGETRRTRNLKASNRRRAEAQSSLAVGDEVEILAPAPGQEAEGKVIKVNKKTDFVTVLGLNFGKKIVRKTKNLRKVPRATKGKNGTEVKNERE